MADQSSKHQASLQVPGRAEAWKLFLEMFLKRTWFLAKETSASMGFRVSGSLVIRGAGGQGQQPGGCRAHLQLSRRAQQRRLFRRFPYELHKHRHLAMDNPAWRLQGLSNARSFVCSSVPMRTIKMLCCSAPRFRRGPRRRFAGGAG